MVRVLLDTCVLSELQRPRGNPRVRAQVAELDPESIFISAITVGELAKGIALLAKGRRKQELASWLSSLEERYDEKILPINREVGRIWGELTARAQTAGTSIPVSDGLIAATGLTHGLHVMTRNTGHFAATGALIIDPWAT